MINHKKLTGFGKQMEYKIISLMLKEGLDVYTPLVDDDSVDLIIKKSNGTFIEIQIKARSKTVAMGKAASFPHISHKKRKNYFFVFYSERFNTFWIMSSEEFLKHSSLNRIGGHIGRRNISFAGKRKDLSFETSAKKDKKTGKFTEPLRENLKKFIAKDFSRFK